MHPQEEFNPYFQSPQRHPRYQPQEPPQHQQGIAPPPRQHRKLRFQEPPQRNQGDFPAALVIPETLLTPQRQHSQPQRQEQPLQQDQEEGLASALFPQRQGRPQRQERPPQHDQEGPVASPLFPQTLVPQQRRHGWPQHDQEGPASAPAPAPQRQNGRQQHQEPPIITPPMPLPIHDPHQQEQGRRTRAQTGLNVIRSRPTNPLAWLLGVFCALLWLVIIMGGLAILIIYLVFRPRSPRFDIPAASLNAVYLDMGVRLNADVTFLANFTNPNQKVKVDFSYIVFGLYYHNTLIASSYSVPFAATRRESRPYWLHARCSINITGPPSGVLVSRKCITKR